MYAKQDEFGSAAAQGMVIPFAPYAAAAWARADRAAPAEGPREAVIITFPRQCPAQRARPAAGRPGAMTDPF